MRVGNTHHRLDQRLRAPYTRAMQQDAPSVAHGSLVRVSQCSSAIWLDIFVAAKR